MIVHWIGATLLMLIGEFFLWMGLNIIFAIPAARRAGIKPDGAREFAKQRADDNRCYLALMMFFTPPIMLGLYLLTR